MIARLPTVSVVLCWVGIACAALSMALRIPEPPSWFNVLGAFGGGMCVVLLFQHYLAGRRAAK